MPKTALIPIERVASNIIVLRGRKVILDADLARIYGVPTKQLNQAVKRNLVRFPSPLFRFRLTEGEAEVVIRSRSQFVTLNNKTMREEFVMASEPRSRSQFATLKRGRNIKYLPYAFTEHGALMAATVLNSPRAVKMSRFLVEAFVQMRETFAAHHELAQTLKELERSLVNRLDNQEKVILQVIERLQRLETPPEPPRKKIGFVQEARGRYRAGKNGIKSKEAARG